MYLFAYKMHCARFALEHIQQGPSKASPLTGYKRDIYRPEHEKVLRTIFRP